MSRPPAHHPHPSGFLRALMDQRGAAPGVRPALAASADAPAGEAGAVAAEPLEGERAAWAALTPGARVALRRVILRQRRARRARAA